MTDPTRYDFILLLAGAFAVIGVSNKEKYIETIDNYFDQVFAHTPTEDEKILFAFAVGQYLSSENDSQLGIATEVAEEKLGRSVFTFEDLLPIVIAVKEYNDGLVVIKARTEEEVKEEKEVDITV